jgi:hypothetical protein
MIPTRLLLLDPEGFDRGDDDSVDTNSAGPAPAWPTPHSHPSPPASSLDDPKTCTLWRTVQSPSDIAYCLQLLRNRAHFGQAQGTPFTQSPFFVSTSFNWQAYTILSESVLSGQCPVSSLSQVPL